MHKWYAMMDALFEDITVAEVGAILLIPLLGAFVLCRALFRVLILLVKTFRADVVYDKHSSPDNRQLHGYVSVKARGRGWLLSASWTSYKRRT